MRFSKKINTVLLCTYILFLIVFTISGQSVTSAIGLTQWSIMIVLVGLLLSQANIKPASLYMIALAVFFFIHIMITDTSPLTAGLFVANILLYLFLPNLCINTRAIGYILFFLFIANFIVGFKEVLYSPFTNNINDAFEGFFRNSNTNGNFACCALMAVLLLLDYKKIRVYTIILFIIYLFACKSRNALLFTLIVMCFYRMLSSDKLAKYVIPSFIAIFTCSLLYLTIIEPNYSINFELFGKKADSAGRSIQILLTIKHFPITFFGVGVDVPNNYVIRLTKYAIHNMYVNTFYAMGCGYMLLFLVFVSNLYRRLRSNLAKAFLIGFLMYFLFEPGIAFGTQLIVSLPFIILLTKLYEEQNEDSTLHLEL